MPTLDERIEAVLQGRGERDNPILLIIDLAAERERLLAALTVIAEDRVPPVEPVHNNRCIHRRNMDEECRFCTVAFARAALASEPRA